tara:strand:+ start:359 stop:562 length:204 start_codon:yes stop_codon:yes gene_type:complete
MKFNGLVDKFLEDFKAPVDTNKRSKVLPGKFTNQNDQLGKPSDSKIVRGFKGQRKGKVKTVKIKMPS